MHAYDAAKRWASTWQVSWPARDAAAIAALYAPGAPYRSHPHREPEPGGALSYTLRTFGEEAEISCWFGDPIVQDQRAAVEWWASWLEEGQEMTLSGTTILRFAADGLVVEHVDYWAQSPGRLLPFAGWGGAGKG